MKSRWEEEYDRRESELRARFEEERRRRERVTFQNACIVIAASTAAVINCALISEWDEFLLLAVAYAIGIAICSHSLALLAHGKRILFVALAGAVVVTLIAVTFHRTVEHEWETRTGAVCEDGRRSSATGSGACSWHGGVDRWITVSHSRVLTTSERWQITLGKYWLFLPFLGSLPIVFMDRLRYGPRA